MNNGIWSMLGWVTAAGVLGFAISAVFTGWLRLSRTRFLLPYVSLAGIFLYGFLIVNEVNVGAVLRGNWVWGVLAGGLVGVFLVKTVRSQPLSRQSNGAGLVFDLAWAGLIYGMIDALFLNVMPAMAVWIGISQFDWAGTVMGKIAVGAAGLFASLLVTLTYHLGYPEFRNKSVMLVLVGNSLITLAFLLSGNPWGSIISHTVMHIAAVLQGAETTIQLPPHYQKKIEAQ
ncbi:MAG: hypothetical protein C3F07_08005 [Anaerolineales bacterium]|nr:hypothetical protein [Anaerolineae bacterium]PWB74341.1 MAG: hypothetical protein C3F07_08005 [Anaerolineales bacterium]